MSSKSFDHLVMFALFFSGSYLHTIYLVLFPTLAATPSEADEKRFVTLLAIPALKNLSS
jgi:hypothetical protein